MTQSERQLPSLKALIAFEAAVRLGSLTAAAKVLSATQPAVSQRIRALEDLVGVPLFERGGNRVKPTKEGQQLYEDVAAALTTIESSITSLQRKAKSPRPKVVIATNFGFAHLWLLPRLPKLEAEFPDVDIEVFSVDRNQDATLSDVDINISFGQVSEDTYLLSEETVFPVCSPEFAKKHGLTGEVSPEQLAELPLLHMDERDPRWMDWRLWHSLVGYPFLETKKSFKYNNYPLLVQAAQSGGGMALGWSLLMTNFIEDGSLIALGPFTTRRNHGYIMRTKYQNNALISMITNWIKSEIQDHDSLKR